MKNWIKIQTFDRYHQAELRKNILTQNAINAVILDEKDSLFLLGSIDLYVEEFNEKKARALIDDFDGLTKVNSFVDLKPVLLFQKVLQDAGIKSILKRKENQKYILDNYELYVENKDVEKVIPYLKGEKLNGWSEILVCAKVRQTKYYVDLLAENSINSIVIKKKDSDYHLETVSIYVKNDESDKAEKCISELKSYVLLSHFDSAVHIERAEEILFSENIQAIIKKDNGNVSLFTKKEDREKAKKILADHKEWVLLDIYSDIAAAMYHKGLLDESGIPSVIMNEKDSVFLLGEIELYIEKDKFDKAQNLISKLN